MTFQGNLAEKKRSVGLGWGVGGAADLGRIHIKESPGCNSERRSPRVEDEELIIL